MTIKVLFTFGTRPEAIKLAPVIVQAKGRKNIHCKICVTGQHREMLDQVLQIFKLKPDYDLDLMSNGQDLFHIVIHALEGLKHVLIEEKPDLVIVQGDTTTTMTAALASFFTRSSIGHVEAGLRTGNKYSPFPEEINRILTSHIADFHFCPTEKSKTNLLKEGVNEQKIFVTGNTVIDSLLGVLDHVKSNNDFFEKKFSFLDNSRKLILVTGHRRENFGQKFLNICEALRSISEKYIDIIDIVYPVHLNPNVQKPVKNILSGLRNIHLLGPLEYSDFVYLMNKSYFILSDSGGIQEEAPALNKPVLVMREDTERPEAAEAGAAKIVGTNKDRIIKEASALLNNENLYMKMANCINPYGDGTAAKKIVDIISKQIK